MKEAKLQFVRFENVYESSYLTTECGCNNIY